MTPNLKMLDQENSILSNDYNALTRVGQHQGDSYIGRGAKQRDTPRPKNVPDLIGAIDQGTSSTRFLVFENQTGRLIASSQMEIKRITPQEGWVEIDPLSIMSSVHATMANVYDQLVAHYNLSKDSSNNDYITNLLSCIGICNQRESTVVWDSQTGQPLYNVIVWMDNRTKYIVDEMIDSIPGRDFNRFKDKTGLPMSTYFSAFKLKWLMENVDDVRQALEEKRLLFGTVDTWILWNLTGGKHLTDVTNASRTFLMDIETLQWDKSLCKYFKVPPNILPEILSSADDYGQIKIGPFEGTSITGVIGDQSAALFGHNCLQIGQTKATFGTGCFIMQNIGPGPLNGAMSGVHRDAKKGLVTTVGYKLGERPACYALEGSVKIAGAALTWLRDNMQLIQNYEECDLLVNKTTHSAGVFFVPALGGLYSPYWDPNAAGIFIGLSQFTRREHLVRATFDSIAFQTNDILSLMRGVANGLMIDGGLCKSENLCQILADITGYDIIKPAMCETSALGAAMVAGYGAKLWSYDSMQALSGEPLRSSMNFSNQTHHYPHESLHYDDRYSHAPKHALMHETNARFRSRAKSLTGTVVSTRHRRTSVKQVHATTTGVQNQQHRQHLKSSYGVNDDAGGGQEGDRGGGGKHEDDNDDAESAASSSQPANSMSTMNTNDSVPSGIESALESSIKSDSQQQFTIMENTQIGSNVDSGNLAPPSSGYSSGDNFEQATSMSGVSIRGRVDSPVSQNTDEVSTQPQTPRLDLDNRPVKNCQFSTIPKQDTSSAGRNESIATDETTEAVEEPIDRRHPSKVFAYNLNKFIANQPEILETVSLSALTCGKLCGETKFDGEDDEDQDEEDMIHEFGGRDSYGEDNYDSSSASLDSYDSEDNDPSNDLNLEQPSKLVLHEGCNENNAMESTNQSAGQQSLIAQARTRHRIPKSQKKLNTLTKQVDIFQPYISLDHRTDLVNTWSRAVERSMQWTKVHHEEVKRIDYQRLSSLPISMYLFLSIGMVALSGFLSSTTSLSAFLPKGQ